MKTINLLPPWYLRQRAQRRNLRIHLALMLALAGVLAGVWSLGQKRIAAVENDRSALEARLQHIPDRSAQVQVQQADLRRLEDLQLAYRELGKTIPMSSVAQQVQNAMTQGMSLAHVQIEVQHDPVKGSDGKETRYHDVAYISVEGIAPIDRQIDQMVESLAKNPLFTDVTLDYVRTGTLQAYIVRRFEIKMKMDLERLTTEDPGMKVADGGSHAH